MKKILTWILLIVPLMLAAQEKSAQKLPSVELKDLNGKVINTAELNNEGKPFIVSFWALWCKPCMRELSAIAEVYDDWQEETGVKLVAISIDDARSSSRVGPTVMGKGWDYEVLLDANGDFKRAMNVNMIPHTFLVNGQGEIVWQHTSFSEGSELELIELVKKVAAGEDISGH
jgi:thiol-disulfide isomerase/thioredoxin